MGWFNKIFEEINLRFFDYSSHSNFKNLNNEKIIENSLFWFRNSAFEGCYASKYSMLWNKYFPPLPESAAGWITTLIRIKNNYPHLYAKVFNNSKPEENIAEWLLAVQRPDGTFASSYEDVSNQPPAVFANGCVNAGLISLYVENKDEKILAAILKSAEWLVQMQMPDGSWQHYTFNVPHANTMTAFSLIRLGSLLNNERFINTGRKNILYTIKQQNENGSFAEASSKAVYHYTDIIGYTLTGILLSANELNDDSQTENVIKGYKSLFNLLGSNGYLPGEINNEFKTTVNYCCLPGNSLLCSLGMMLYKKTGNEVFKTAAGKLIQYAKEKQLHSRHPYLEGGIPASWPISGKYLPYELNSTGERLFVEALIEMELKMP
ncbi:MAG TPA: prenyltransferase/squalene oxidase repeat-containing protein [Bacteroidia bacterium]|nr:prenyltransferase/squalene oxidase repeat-containing protein [Bacteroidia bacterium]